MSVNWTETKCTCRRQMMLKNDQFKKFWMLQNSSKTAQLIEPEQWKKIICSAVKTLIDNAVYSRGAWFTLFILVNIILASKQYSFQVSTEMCICITWRYTLSSNQKQNQNELWLAYTQFPLLHVNHMTLLLVFFYQWSLFSLWPERTERTCGLNKLAHQPNETACELSKPEWQPSEPV